MKKQISNSILIVAALLLAACHRNDIRSESFYIEQFRSADAVQILSNALRPLPGIQAVNSLGNDRIITIVYDGTAIHRKNIEYEIVNAGFSLTNWPATAQQKAKLPESLR